MCLAAQNKRRMVYTGKEREETKDASIQAQELVPCIGTVTKNFIVFSACMD
jgi:hypothetical protein